jgi:hypothetical protein
MTETALTLALLFQFCYPDRHPHVEMLGFSEFALLHQQNYKVFDFELLSL